MSKLIAVAAMIVCLGAPALAQSGGNVSVPSGQNSGAGIQGHPGNKNGPAAKSPTTGSATSTSEQDAEQGKVTRQQDSAKIPGKTGGKSGPAARRPSK
jgi:hypothetical protein